MLKIIVLLVLIAPLLVYSIRKRTFLYLIFALLPILPDAFAIELSESLPLISGSRMLICCIIMEWAIKKFHAKSIYIPKAILIYIVFNILLSVIHLCGNLGEINRIFILVVEQLLLVLVVIDLIPDKKVLHECIGALLYGSFIVAIIAIGQSLLKIDLASVLMLVESAVNGQVPGRLGTVRAYGTSNAILYGCICSFMVLIGIYAYEQKKQIVYLAVCAINMVALFLTMTRSAILALLIVLVIMFLLRNKVMIRKYIKFVPVVLLAIVAVVVVKPDLMSNSLEIIKSVLNVFGADMGLTEDFGANADNAVNSRMLQWSAVYYMIREGKGLLGYGYAAYARGELYYYFEQFTAWVKAGALDVGFVKIATESGILGLLSHIGILAYVGVDAFHMSKGIRKLELQNFMVYFVILYLIVNVASSSPDGYVFWLTIALYFAYKKKNISQRS